MLAQLTAGQGRSEPVFSSVNKKRATDGLRIAFLPIVRSANMYRHQAGPRSNVLQRNTRVEFVSALQEGWLEFIDGIGPHVAQEGSGHLPEDALDQVQPGATLGRMKRAQSAPAGSPDRPSSPAR